jgi:hypothetical protein
MNITVSIWHWNNMFRTYEEAMKRERTMCVEYAFQTME